MLFGTCSTSTHFYTYRWWDRTTPGDKLEFARDRLAASFLWGVGLTSEPQHGYCRLQITKAIQVISVIDDVYDVYGTLEELELFTKVVERFVFLSF